MRIPNRILEHPVESALAGLLLLALLFVSAGQEPATHASSAPVPHMTEKT